MERRRTVLILQLGLFGVLMGAARALSVVRRKRAKSKVVVVKFGGAAITVKSKLRCLNSEALAQCASAVAAARSAGWSVVVVHGAGSFGHFEAKKFGLSRGASHAEWRHGLVQTRAAVCELNALTVAALDEAGVAAVGLSPLALVRTKEVRAGQIKGCRRLAMAARDALGAGFVPVVHGDALFDAEQGCSILSGDVLCHALCDHLNAEKAVFVTDVEGIYDRPPLEKGARLLRHLTAIPAPFRIRALLTGRPQPAPLLDSNIHTSSKLDHDVTGGMAAKLDAALRCAALKAPVTIVSVPYAEKALLAPVGELPAFPSTVVTL